MSKFVKVKFDLNNNDVAIEVLELWKTIQQSEEQLGEDLKYEVEYKDDIKKSSEIMDLILVLLYGLDGISFIQDFIIEVIISLFEKKKETIHIKLKDGTELTYEGEKDIQEITSKLKELGRVISQKGSTAEDIVVSFKK